MNNLCFRKQCRVSEVSLLQGLIFLPLVFQEFNGEGFILILITGMACFKLTLVLLLICLASSISKELIKFTISSYLMPDKKLSMELDVVTPRTPGSYPPMLFVTGI